MRSWDEHDADEQRWLLMAERDHYADALKAISTSADSGEWVEVYRTAGGGYEGLQAIAEAALERGQKFPQHDAPSPSLPRLRSVPK